MDMDIDMTEQRNNTDSEIVQRVDAQTQTDTVEVSTLSQKLTALAHHELQLESAAQLAPAPPPAPPPSSTITTNTPLDKFDKDILRWKDVHFLRDFGDWFNPEKAVQPTYTRLLSSCGYYDPNSPLDLGLVDGHGHSPPLGVDLVESSDTGIPNQNSQALVNSDVNDTDVEKDVGKRFVPNTEDTISTTVEPIDTANPISPTDATSSIQTTVSPTHPDPVTVDPSLDATSVRDTRNPDSESDPIVSSRTD